MNQTIRSYRVLHSFVQRREVKALQALADQASAQGTDSDSTSKTRWGEIIGAVLAITGVVVLASALSVIRLATFHPEFAQILEKTAQLIATELPF